MWVKDPGLHEDPRQHRSTRAVQKRKVRTVMSVVNPDEVASVRLLVAIVDPRDRVASGVADRVCDDCVPEV